MSLAKDATGTYALALTVMAGVMLAASVMVIALRGHIHRRDMSMAIVASA